MADASPPAMMASVPPQDTGGVAYMAHVGEFVAGFVLTLLLRDRRRAPPLQGESTLIRFDIVRLHVLKADIRGLA